MRVSILIEIELERETGKFIARDDLIEQIMQEVETANPDSVDVDESTYTVGDWTVSDVTDMILVRPSKEITAAMRAVREREQKERNERAAVAPILPKLEGGTS